MDSNPAMTTDETWVFNGIDGASGGYLLPEMTPAQVSALAQGQSIDRADTVDELKQRAYDLQNPHAGVESDARDLAETGWGVIFAYDADPASRKPWPPFCRCVKNKPGSASRVSGGRGLPPAQSKNDFLEAPMGPGPADPDKVPYYLMIVGDPAQSRIASSTSSTSSTLSGGFTSRRSRIMPTTLKASC